MDFPKSWSVTEMQAAQSWIRLAIATYLLGQMMETPASNGAEVSAKERKVKAAFEYADLLLKG